MSDSDDTTPVPAGLFRRLAALFYDGMLLLALLMIATALLLPLTGGEAIPSHDPLYRTYLFFITFFYFAWHWVRGGQTLGMKAWKIKLVQKNGMPLTWWHALLRFMLALPSGLFFGLGFIWAVFDKNRQTWHDRLAETMMIREFYRKTPEITDQDQ